MKTFACKTMAYFDRWVALMKANDDEAAKKFTSTNLGDCSVMSKGDKVIVEQVGRLFLYNACVRKLGDIDWGGLMVLTPGNTKGVRLKNNQRKSNGGARQPRRIPWPGQKRPPPSALCHAHAARSAMVLDRS